MRERLAEIYHNIEIEYLDYLTNIAERAIDDDIEDKIQKRQEFYVDKLLEKGVIIPPCKVGDTVYEITGNASNKIMESKVVAIIIATDGKFGVRTDYSFPITREIGRMLFLTKEEAENALNNEEESNKE